MAIIRIAGIDPSFRNFGIARMLLDTDTLKLEIEDLILLETEGKATKDKSLRKNSDDLRRANELQKGFFEGVEGCTVAFAEIPSGAQSARAAYSFGLCLGLLACCPVPLYQVQVSDAKRAAVGTRTASKEEMIEWAAGQWPKAPWRTYKRKGQILMTDSNEHMADACAIATAGIGLTEFQGTLALMRSMNKAA